MSQKMIIARVCNSCESIFYFLLEVLKKYFCEISKSNSYRIECVGSVIELEDSNGFCDIYCLDCNNKVLMEVLYSLGKILSYLFCIKNGAKIKEFSG